MEADSFSGTPSSLRRARMVVMSSCMVCISAMSGFVAGIVGGLRVAGEGDGFGGRQAGVEGVPYLFGEEGHEGREQAQGGLEDVRPG